MAITFPRSLPDTTSISSIIIEPMVVVGITKSIYTLEEQIQIHQGQAWRASVTLRVKSKANADPWMAWLLSLNGPGRTFLMGDPAGATPRGSAADTPGTPVVNGGSQTGNTLAISGAPAGASGYLLTGDYIQLGSGSTTQLHRVLSDADTDSAGEVTLDIWPNLRESPSNGATVVVENTVGVWRLEQVPSFVADTAKLYSLSFDCMESL